VKWVWKRDYFENIFDYLNRQHEWKNLTPRARPPPTKRTQYTKRTRSTSFAQVREPGRADPIGAQHRHWRPVFPSA